MREWRSVRIELSVQLVAFVVLVTCVSLLWRYNLILLLVMAAICGIALARWHERFDLCFFLVIAVLGTMAEMVFVYFGVWEYANPTFMDVPVWFPLAFGTTGLIGGRLARTMTTIWNLVNPEGDAPA